jgi:putative transposase
MKNGRAAKRALNRKMASVNPGQIRAMTAYKLAHRGKLLIKVPAAFTSQRCSVCGYTHEDNRPTQNVFLCKQCSYEANADDNAAANIKQLGFLTVRDDTFLGKRKTARKIAVRKSARKQAGQCSAAREEASSGSGVASKPPLGEQATAMDQTSIES